MFIAVKYKLTIKYTRVRYVLPGPTAAQSSGTFNKINTSQSHHLLQISNACWCLCKCNYYQYH